MPLALQDLRPRHPTDDEGFGARLPGSRKASSLRSRHPSQQVLTPYSLPRGNGPLEPVLPEPVELLPGSVHAHAVAEMSPTGSWTVAWLA